MTAAFYVGKIVFIALRPGNLLLLLAFAGMIGGRRRWAGAALVAGVGGMLLITVLPVGAWLLTPLENRFAVPAPWPDRLDGVIVLGGGVQPDITADRDSIALNDGGERQTAMLAFIRRYPLARVVFTGGVGQLDGAAVTEAEVVRRLLLEQAVPEGRVLLEDRSRTTHENALYTKALVRPAPGERWLLITSAAHMPRSVGVFRKQGWPVEAWPVDYRTSGELRLDLDLRLDRRLARLEDAAYEWSGLLWYRILGYTDALLPGPLPAGGR